MDNTSLSLILTALTLGATAGLKDTASQAVKDGYEKLKTLLQKKLAGTPPALVALTEHEKQPATWKAPLEAGLITTGADQDQEIIAAAQHLITMIQVNQAKMNNTLIQNLGTVQGQVIDNQGTITMNFGEIPPAKG